MTIDPRQLACLLACYEMDELHIDTPRSKGSDYYPSTSWEAICRDASQDHDGDCNNQPQPCVRCWAEAIIHKANWIAEKLNQPAYQIGPKWFVPDPPTIDPALFDMDLRGRPEVPEVR